jgi:hypothetical protein
MVSSNIMSKVPQQCSLPLHHRPSPIPSLSSDLADHLPRRMPKLELVVRKDDGTMALQRRTMLSLRVAGESICCGHL